MKIPKWDDLKDPKKKFLVSFSDYGNWKNEYFTDLYIRNSNS
jgi:hypothetical protein